MTWPCFCSSAIMFFYQIYVMCFCVFAETALSPCNAVSLILPHSSRLLCRPRHARHVCAQKELQKVKSHTSPRVTKTSQAVSTRHPEKRPLTSTANHPIVGPCSLIIYRIISSISPHEAISCERQREHPQIVIHAGCVAK